jgi:hypothetical protein
MLLARRIREALGYQSPAVAGAVQSDLERAIDAGSLTAAMFWQLSARQSLQSSIGCWVCVFAHEK